MTKQPTSLNNVCERCGGTGMYIFMQKSSEYAEENDKPLKMLYKEDWEIPVGKPCPFCNGGFADDVIKAKKSADIPNSFYNKRLSDFDWSVYVTDDGKTFDTSSQQNGVRSFIEQFEVWENKNTGLYIYSKTKGSGKTFLASCICNELMNKKAIRTRFVKAIELIDIALSGDKDANDEYKRNPMKLLHECKFLVIDDLGQGNVDSKFFYETLLKLLDYRMNNSRMTMITSNYAIQELPLGEAITDRINKLCMPFHLPEICVRSKEIRESRQALLRELELNKKEAKDE